MPRFLDVHSLEGIHDEGTLRKLRQSPRDEFGVKHINIFFNRQANICFCLLEARIEKQLKAIMKNIASNAIGSQKYGPLNEHDSKSQAGNLRTETLKSNNIIVFVVE